MKKTGIFAKSAVLILSVFLFGGWGSVGHKLINRSTVSYFPSSMSFLSSWSDSISIHASDADNRKSSDPTEDMKHYIDIDSYSDFVKDRRIIQNYDSIVAKYGLAYVTDIGILPWAIINTCDSLKNAFMKKDWHKAMLIASDLGHYVGDAHMPMHITKNYNGQYTSQTGVHSRYESDLIGKYSTSISFPAGKGIYVSDISAYTFSMVYNNYNYVDSVLAADKAAKAAAGSTSGTVYLQKFWDNAGSFTILLFDKAAISISDLIYTCWVNAGSPTNTNFVEQDNNIYADDFKLEQNFPNPFNPSTVINYTIKNSGFVTLKVYDNLGREVKTLINSNQNAGSYSVDYNAAGLSSGVYFCNLKVGDRISKSMKMILLR